MFQYKYIFMCIIETYINNYYNINLSMISLDKTKGKCKKGLIFQHMYSALYAILLLLQNH